MKTFVTIFLLIALSSVSFGQSVDNQDPVNVDYTVWVGDDVDTANSITVSVPRNSAFFDVMTQAAEDDSSFAFEYETFNIGRMITSIGGNAQNPDTNLYWFLYRLPGAPDTENKPSTDFLSPVGVDVLRVRDEGNYLFWLRTWNPDE